MNQYQVKVIVESNEGEEFTYVCRKYFCSSATEREMKCWVDGVESGAAIVHDGAILSSELIRMG